MSLETYPGLVASLAGFPDWLAVFLMAALPVAELRLALPVAADIYQMDWFSSWVWSISGNLLPIPFIWLFLRYFQHFLTQHSHFAQRFFDWLFARTRAKFTSKYQKYGAMALIIFVGIPLPFTGAWTATVAAYLFGIPFKRALIYIFLGLLMSAGIVSFIIAGLQ